MKSGIIGHSSKGRASDVKKVLKTVKLSDFIESFGRIKNYLPKEVRSFWEEWLGDINKPTERSNQEP
jgi:hypothetical protein